MHTTNVLAQAQRVAIRTSAIVIAVYVLSYLPYSALQTAKTLLGYEWYAKVSHSTLVSFLSRRVFRPRKRLTG